MKKRATSMAELGEIHAKSFNPEGIARSIKSYQPRASDVIITPYGKSGTTWTQQIFHTLRTRGDMDFDDISRVVPWIEMTDLLQMDINAEQRVNPRGFKSHLEWEKLPRGAKYINVIRDPLDVAYSAFRFMEGWFVEPDTIPAEVFISARAKDASYHKHFVSWWKHRNDDDVLYLVYEHMKKDREGVIRRIADFAGIELDDELLALTLEHSSIDFMKAHKDRFDDAMLRAKSEEYLPSGSDSAKVRVGMVGEFTWPDEIVAMYDELWQTHVAPETGFTNYQDLIASLA
ncbi:MAG: sulfotransferase domain-containing protein [Pseudomonadales bacterium]|nr:sulfotransferase domain-containing protein [Pseudomonadales bacterium]MBO6564703.1 sulfotransferase domain-containing protein [Pseudomonadales bacterium]MBO6594381.1 sulfotransferase domain-containing protein [Pseudomonadales bacterium]MBO6655557.1 sulfotransferase domain-containing protein [Pseudomonadales bacterium]MBO6822058.1 sulfotransferase domain-containing protein [Pseudomonadales bacterium]